MKKIILLVCMAFTLSAQAQQKPAEQKPAQPKTDTTRSAPVQQQYFLIGTLDNFRLLFAAVSSPGDVTPNQQKSLVDWINNRLSELKTDSLPKKK